MGVNDIKNRIIQSIPALGDLLKVQTLMGEEIVSGAIAGDIAVPGIKLGDNLSSVIDLTTPADVTSNFTITSDGVITGAATTAGLDLKVLYEKWILR